MSKLVSMERISLKATKDVNEKMIQEYIFTILSCLGLGDLSISLEYMRAWGSIKPREKV